MNDQNPDTQQASKPETPRPPMNAWRAFQTIAAVAILIATLFTLWTPTSLFTVNSTNLQLAILPPEETPTTMPTPLPSEKPRLGILVGHWGKDDGWICPDGVREVDINLRIGTLAQQELAREGYSVDLLQENDPRLIQYQALALVSVHSDSCDFLGDTASGFKVAPALASLQPEKAAVLTACMIDRYANVTGLNYKYNEVTTDMSSYHPFDEVNSITPIVVIEVGYLNLDRQILTEKPDLLAFGIASGVLCYIRGEPIP
ncbi:MAG: N-acetylmuramoyl-L-alanine amidase [Anaerolineaceae bacterium]